MKIYREPEPTKILDQWRPGDYDGPDGPPDQPIIPNVPDEPEEIIPTPESVLYPHRQPKETVQPVKSVTAEEPTRAVKTKVPFLERLAEEDKTIEDRLTEFLDIEFESAKDKKEHKEILEALHKVTKKYRIKSEPYWLPPWMDKVLEKEEVQKDKPMTAFLKMWPRFPDVMNGIDKYQWEHPIDVKKKHQSVRTKTDKNGKKKAWIVEYGYAAFQSDAMFGETIGNRIGLTRDRLNKYINVLKKWGWLEWMEDTGRYHNIPVYASAFYSYYKNDVKKIVLKYNHLMNKRLWHTKIKELKGKVD